jgi:hypothetical protein
MLTPASILELANMAEACGEQVLRDMMDDKPDMFWDVFGRFTNPGRLWTELSDAELVDINQRFIAQLHQRARLRTQ